MNIQKFNAPSYLLFQTWHQHLTSMLQQSNFTAACILEAAHPADHPQLVPFHFSAVKS
jgi:hypothetical protein